MREHQSILLPASEILLLICNIVSFFYNLPFKSDAMEKETSFEVVIAGGSYAGLSAAMALGRALRRVLVIDSGLPCNRQTPHSHNFLTQDGVAPAVIASIGREQLNRYSTVQWLQDVVTDVQQEAGRFRVATASGKIATAQKILFATGITDHMPAIPGFADCWGISVLHCPYCHGFEVAGQPTGILASGELAYEFATLIHNWTKQLTLFTNGPSGLRAEQAERLQQQGIQIVEQPVQEILHEQGHLQQLVFSNGQTHAIRALYARVPFSQHSPLPEALGCALNSHGLLQTDDMLHTTVPGIYAAGDNCSPMRSVAAAVAAGNKAGAVINKDLISENPAFGIRPLQAASR